MFIVYAIFQRIVWLATFLWSRVFNSFKIIDGQNLKNLPKPLMIISNHRTFLDPLIIGTLFPLFSKYIPITFMVDDRYYNNIFLKPFFLLTQTFPAYYGQGLDISLKKPKQVLKNGGVFLIFPTGERHLSGPQPRPKRGAAILALENPQLTILPIYLRTGASKVTVVVGNAFKLTNVTQSQDIETVAQVLADEIYKLDKI